MTQFVFSDPHFDSERIIKYGKRPFANIAQMNNTLISNYNAIVGKNDICWWLGDVMFGATKEKVRRILSQMYGKKYLLKGNHDRGHSRKWWLDCGFDQVFDNPVYLAEYYIMLSHEPLEEFGNNIPVINYHGHIHIQDYDFPYHPGCINACVEKTNYHPIPLVNPYIKNLRIFER